MTDNLVSGAKICDDGYVVVCNKECKKNSVFFILSNFIHWCKKYLVDVHWIHSYSRTVLKLIKSRGFLNQTLWSQISHHDVTVNSIRLPWPSTPAHRFYDQNDIAFFERIFTLMSLMKILPPPIDKTQGGGKFLATPGVSFDGPSNNSNTKCFNTVTEHHICITRRWEETCTEWSSRRHCRFQWGSVASSANSWKTRSSSWRLG